MANFQYLRDSDGITLTPHEMNPFTHRAVSNRYSKLLEIRTTHSKERRKDFLIRTIRPLFLNSGIAATQEQVFFRTARRISDGAWLRATLRDARPVTHFTTLLFDTNEANTPKAKKLTRSQQRRNDFLFDTNERQREMMPRCKIGPRATSGCAAAPRSEARDPARHVRAEGLVFGAEGFAQRGLLVNEDEEVRGEPGNQRVRQHTRVTEQQGLPENYRDDRNVHGIANVSVEAFDHQMLGGKDGRGRAQTLQGEARERIEQHEYAGGKEQDADHPERNVTCERCAELPAGNPPGRQSRDDAGREHEEPRRSQQREHAPDAVVRLRWAFSGHMTGLPAAPHFSSGVRINRAKLFCKSRVILRGTMSVIISMLRGVNVGGHNKIKMDQLRAVYQSLGFRDAQTYIQSGNVVCRADKRELATAGARIEKGIERNFGFRPSVIVRTAPELREVIVRNPFAKRSGIDASRLLVAFLASSPAADALDKVLKIKCEPEELRVSGRELFIYFPNGMARPKLSLATVERTLKISSTGRNWNTVRKLLEMAEALEAAG